MKSLWLHPQRKAARVLLARFAWYPHFLENLGDSFQEMFSGMSCRLPTHMTVRWIDFDFFLAPIETHNSDEDARELAFIDEVAEYIRQGQDVPPLVTYGREPEDGLHRAWAAHKIGLKIAPIIEITE